MTYDLQSHFASQIQRAEGESSKVYEAVIGIVTDNKDPSKIGRVKVKVPILSDDDSTFWLPIVMLGAGKNRGWFFIPEPDDEVLVMFEHGSADHGVVIGALFNGKDVPPDNNKDGKNDRRVIKSRQKSRIVMDDGDSPNVIIEDGSGKGRITIDTQNNKIIIEALEGDVCFQTPQGEMKIVAKAVDLKAQQAGIEVHCGTQMAWGSDSDATISGQSGVTMSGATHNNNNGVAQAPQAPTSDPQDVDDPYGC
jgi:uncharacterized protein involved in type VI secretion and phage assembly